MAKNENKKMSKVSSSGKVKKSIATAGAGLDPLLEELFESSIGPAPIVKKDSSAIQKPVEKIETTGQGESSESESVDSDSDSNSDLGSESGSESERASETSSDSELPSSSKDLDTGPSPPEPSRKRKRNAPDDDLEERYLKRLASEKTVEGTTTEEGSRSQSRSHASAESQATRTHEQATANGVDSDEESYEVPQHETLTGNQEAGEVEKASRTVFLGNVSSAAITSKASRRILLEHLASFFSELPTDQKHKVESLRFRSTAFADTSLPKKAAFVKKELREATTHSTNAYAVYNTQLAAREAVRRLNASIVLERHLRVDGVAHPSRIDHRRCVFVGNLRFVDDESNIKAVDEEEGRSKQQTKKNKPPADVDEGLWRQFGKAGCVESVRVIRDRATRVGKGFAYVQFEDPNSVEKALLFNDQKYPPLLPLKLRVTRAKKVTKTASALSKEKPLRVPIQKGTYQAKPSSQVQSLAGRAGKLFGRAGEQKFLKQASRENPATSKGHGRPLKAPEDVIFEGHRAKQGEKPLKLGKSKKGKKTKRSTAYRSRMRKGK